MKNNTRIIWTAGQQTALVVQDEITDSKKTALTLLAQYPAVDQIGFVSDKTATLIMMGDELSINGCIAAGFLLGKIWKRQNVQLATSCLKNRIRVKINGPTTIARFPNEIIVGQTDNQVLLQGIRYQLIQGLPKSQTLTTQQSTDLDKMLALDPAAGLVFYEGTKIVPVIAVVGTNTLCWEQACGSGSLAYWAISGCSKVLQPSGEYLSITSDNQSITIAASTKEIII